MTLKNIRICNDTVQLPLGLLLYLLDVDGTWAELQDAFLRLPWPEEIFTVQHEAVPPQ